MATERQNEANRANAQKSTGPKTDEGKVAASQNARRHGLSSATIFVPDERAGEFQATFTAYFNEIRPVGEIQMTYFEQLVHAVWNLNIARELLVRALHEMDDKKISNANRYVAQYERAFAKAHKAIKEDQTDMALRAIPENEAISDLPLTCQIRVIANEATRVAAQQERTQRPTQRTAILERVGASFRPAPSEPMEIDDENEAKLDLAA